MEKILELEFNDDVTIDKIYAELEYYKKQGIVATCKYKNHVLSNENENLKSLIDRLKLNMSEFEYQEHLEKEKKEIADYNIFATIVSAPKLLKYYIERGALFISEPSKKEDFIFECYFWYSVSPNYFKSIKLATKLLEALHFINLNKVDIGREMVDKAMDDLIIDDDHCIDIAEAILSKVLKDDTNKIEDLLLLHSAEENKKAYEKKLEIKYSKSK